MLSSFTDWINRKFENTQAIILEQSFASDPVSIVEQAPHFFLGITQQNLFAFGKQ